MSKKSKHYNYSAQDDIFSLAKACLHPSMWDVFLLHTERRQQCISWMRFQMTGCIKAVHLNEWFPNSVQTFSWSSDTSVLAAVKRSLSPSATPNRYQLSALSLCQHHKNTSCSVCGWRRKTLTIWSVFFLSQVSQFWPKTGINDGNEHNKYLNVSEACPRWGCNQSTWNRKSSVHLNVSLVAIKEKKKRKLPRRNAK